MEKAEFINNVVCDMTNYISDDAMSHLKVIMQVHLTGVNLTSSETMPSVAVYDNDYILKRYVIDLTARGRKKSTIQNYVLIMRRFFEDTGLNYLNTTGEDVMEYIALKRYRDGISNGYASTLQRYFSSFFLWAYRKKHIGTDISLDIDKIHQPNKHKERLDNEEIEKCRQVVRGDLKASALLELMLSAGPRIGEIVNMQVQQLDFQRGEIRIWGEKTSEWRTCFMTPRCKVVMQEYLAGRTTGPVFVGKRRGTGGTNMCEWKLQSMAKEIADKAGCHCKATVHVYRKTFATREYYRTRDLLYVSKRLGHANVETTRRYYIADDIEMDRLQSVMAG